jgi:hypothetical protein
MSLDCKACTNTRTNWPDDTPMEAVALHFNVEHDTDKIEINLVAVCTCGEAMKFVSSAHWRNDITDFFSCSVCGNTGYTERKAT